MTQQIAHHDGNPTRRFVPRAAYAVAAVGIVCSLAMGVVVQRAAKQLDTARLINVAEVAAEQVQLRLRDLEAGLTATAAFLRHADGAGTQGGTGFQGTGLRPFVRETVLRGETARSIAVLRGRTVEVIITDQDGGAPDPAELSRLVADRPQLDPSMAGQVVAALTPDGEHLVLGTMAGDRLVLLTADAAGVFESGHGPAAGAWSEVQIRAMPADPMPAAPDITAGNGRFSKPVAVGDMGWRLEFTVAPDALPRGLRWEALAMVSFGLALTLLTAVHAQNIQRRGREKALLARRLEVTNTELRNRIGEREQFASVMRESERRFRDIYENALEGIFTTSPKGTFLSANPAMVRMLGYGTEEELIAGVEDTSRQLYVDPARRLEFARMVGAQGTVTDFEAEIRRRDGSTLWLSMTARALRDDGGELVAFQGTAQDVTARRRAEEGLRLAKEQADMANRAKTEFLANMSHELRTPLNAIIGFSEIIGDQSLGRIENEAYADYARDIYESGRMLLDLINDILDLSKIEAGRKEINERTVDVPRLVRSSLRLVRERALKGSVEVLTDLPDGLPPVWADEIACKQILSNLLSNAVKFTPAGGTVTAGAHVADDGRLVLTVTDTGIGIKPEDISKALEPFRQIEGSLTRSTGGVGLGLPLVQALVALHQGEFGLESTPGKGTVARVWLPADRLRVTPGLIPARVKV